ncbi:MAG: M14 family zinc carboxypeptidase, partial [Gemmatimonadota bacterium]
MTQRARPRGPLAAAATLSLSTLVVVLSPPTASPAAAQAQLRTAAEESGFERHTRHPELMSYLRAVRASSTEMRLGTYGTTYEGRELPYAVFSRPTVTQPWEAWASGKPVLVLAANVHGDERTLRESLLILTRELATPGTEANALLDELVIVVVPTINPDGFEASEGGTRGNAWGIDLNRDYAKLEQEAIQAFVTDVLARWRPHLSIDGHNGGSYPYNLNYQCTSNAGADPSITALCDDEIFPYIDRRMEENDFQSWYYSRGDSTKWMGGGSDVRIGRNYGGLANVVTILYESPGGQSLETGVRAGVVGYEAVLEWSRENAELLMSTVDEARRTTAAFGDGAWDDFAVQQEYGPEPYPVEYRIAVREGGEEDEEDAEARIVDIRSDSLMKRPIPTLVRERPFAYILPRDAVDAVDLIRRHGITVEVLEEAAEL